MSRPSVDPDAVIAAIRQAAVDEILPRFGRLASGDIRHKRSPRDLVTTADERAEELLTQLLPKLAPLGGVIVGEEAADANPAIFDRLAGAEPVWLIDPVDGTNNFIHAKSCFAVIVALCLGGEVVGGWIHAPVEDITVWAISGEGAWLDEAGTRRRLRPERPRNIAEMRGSLTHRAYERLYDRRLGMGVPPPVAVVRYGSTGREYIDLGIGALHFAQYTRLKPWDHAAGVLVHREAGGYDALRGSGAPYRAEPHIVAESLLLAPDVATWQALDRDLG